MNTIAFVKSFFVATLIAVSSSVLAVENHVSMALQATETAATEGSIGNGPALQQNLTAALQHAQAASTSASAENKAHLDMAIKKLQEANELSTKGHVGVAASRAKIAAGHFKAIK